MAYDHLASRVHEIARYYVEGYRAQKERAAQILSQMESLEEREALARTEPEIARAFESRTTTEREERIEALCVGLGVAHAILYALGETN